MQTFLNLSVKQAKGIDEPIFENAQELFQNANLLAEHANSYSKATSLLILSLEETIKAIIIKLHSEGLKVYNIDGVQKFVKDHKIRHQIAQLIETGSGLLEVYDGWIEAKNKPHKFKKQWLNDITNGLQAALKFNNTYQRVEKLKKFNDLKNQGLYTEYRNELILPKDGVLEKDFNEVKEIVERTFNFYRLVRIIYNSNSNNSPSNQRNEYIKIHLKTFVDDVLNEFSFRTSSSENFKKSKSN